MKKLIVAAILACAAPAFAGNDLSDAAKDTSDGVQDALHTDSGMHKAKRHAEAKSRHVAHHGRHAKAHAKAKLDRATR